jgi:hypothetical protein
VVWQFTGIHSADKRGDRVLQVVAVEIIEGSLLAPLDIFIDLSRGMSVIRD